MKGPILILIVVALMMAGVFFVFRQSSKIVTSIDGNRTNDMVQLTGDYYYKRSDRHLWLKETKLNSFKKISQGIVDTISWNDNLILGFSLGEYFVIKAKSAEMKSSSDKELMEGYLDRGLRNMSGVPGFRIQR